MVKVTVECNGDVVTREGNLAVVAVASDEEGKVACEQIVRGHGALYLNAVMLVLAGALPPVLAEHTRDPYWVVANLAEFSRRAEDAVQECSRRLLGTPGKRRTETGGHREKAEEAQQS